MFSKKLVLILTFTLFLSDINAECNFMTGSYINELSNPKYINKIEVKVPKSAKFSRNVLKILVSDSKNIKPKFKKRFNANIIIVYDFGTCTYKGRVRQSGDWKDHIKLLDAGNPIMSLDVKLETGNIMGAVSFKLLIPETRNGMNEILGSLFLRELGMIAPETFEIKTIINGIENVMLFQENSAKELLERNLRRESAIFEGDESILWSFEDYEIFELEKIALSRMINDNWFLKGNSSQEISLRAFKVIQYAYLNFHSNNEDKLNNLPPIKTYGIDPNLNKSTTFTNYFFALLSMNGNHALRPHNQKFYFNPFISEFEPIYYDGDLKFKKFTNTELKNFAKIINNPIDKTFLELMKEKVESNDLKESFFNRTISENEQYDFFENAIDSLLFNTKLMYEQLSNIKASKNKINEIYIINKKYKLWNEMLGFNQEIYFKDSLDTNNYKISSNKKEGFEISALELSKLLSKNSLNAQRAILIPTARPNLSLDNYLISTDNFRGSIYGPSSLQIEEDVKNKLIKITQNQTDDWVLISNVDISNWTFIFTGMPENHSNESIKQQRFNKFGFTGCLNFHDVAFNETQIEVISGGCEDSLNIVNSHGQINSIRVDNAAADAIDFDFSNISINSVNVIKAGNDCFDVSGGVYKIISFESKYCNDKGISVGEHSVLHAKNLNINSAAIGISSKDSSKVFLQRAIINAVNCFESSQKKQEFGGSYLQGEFVSCDNPSIIDQHSLVKIKNEF